MKRIHIAHGTARVDDNVSQETIDFLNKLSVVAFRNGEPGENFYWTCTECNQATHDNTACAFCGCESFKKITF